MNQQTIERFWSHVEKTETCWLWTGSKRNKGYGAFVWADVEGKVVQGRAHRFVYELLVSPIPAGLFVLHHCDNPACVNPDHLFVGTNQDNVSDMMQKGRHVAGGTYTEGKYERGVKHHNARLTEYDIKAIRTDRVQGLSYSNLAEKYGIAPAHAYRIVNRYVWSHVE